MSHSPSTYMVTGPTAERGGVLVAELPEKVGQLVGDPAMVVEIGQELRRELVPEEVLEIVQTDDGARDPVESY